MCYAAYMKTARYFIFFLICIATALIGCTESGQNVSLPTSTPIKQHPVEPPEPKKTYAKKLSQIYGYWDIISFDDYEPVRLSYQARNKAYVHFMEDQANFRLECNSASMPAKITFAGVLKKTSRLKGIISTLMGCGEELETRERIFFNFFNSRPKIEIVSPTELRLTTDEHVLILSKSESTSNNLNSLWQLKSVNGTNVWPSNDPRSDYFEFYSNFKERGVRGYTGCKMIRGRTKFWDNRIKINKSITQLNDQCENIKKLSQYYSELLDTDGIYEIAGHNLLILDKNIRYNFVKLDAKPQKQPHITEEPQILSNPFTRKTEGGDEHFFLDDWGKWQFSNHTDAWWVSQIGPDYVPGYKPFIKFNPQREMWGQDGDVFFHRRYTFDDNTITFSPDLRRCEVDCFDTSVKLGKNKRLAQERFMGRYKVNIEGDVLTLSNENETATLEPYVDPPPLPPLPKDQALCEIRDIRPNETFPDHPKASFPEFGFNVMGSDQTLMWDHQGGQQGAVELADGQDVLFEGTNGVKVLRRVSAYNTMAIFGEYGLYCMHWSKDTGRTWPNINVIETTEVPPVSSIPIRSQIVEENKCVRIETRNGDRYTPLFSAYWMAGYDDFGVFLKDQAGSKKRVGDSLMGTAGNEFDFEAYAKKANKFISACPPPYRVFEP